MPFHTPEEQEKNRRRRQQQQPNIDPEPRQGLLSRLGFGTSESGRRQTQALASALGLGGGAGEFSDAATDRRVLSQRDELLRRTGRTEGFPVTAPTPPPSTPTVVAATDQQQPAQTTARDRILGSITRRGTGETQEFTGQQLADIAAGVNVADLRGSTAELQRANEIRRQTIADQGGGGGLDPIRQRLRQRVLSGGIGSRAALEGLLQLEELEGDRAAQQATAQRQGLLGQLGLARLGLEEQRLGLEQGREQRQVREEFRTGVNEFLSPQLESEDPRQQRQARRIGSLASELAAQSGATGIDAGAAVTGAELLSKVFSQATGRGLFDFSEPELLQTLSQARDFTLVFDGDELDEIEFTDASGKEFKTNIDPGFFELGGISGAEAGTLVALLQRFNENVNVKRDR